VLYNKQPEPRRPCIVNNTPNLCQPKACEPPQVTTCHQLSTRHHPCSLSTETCHASSTTSTTVACICSNIGHPHPTSQCNNQGHFATCPNISLQHLHRRPTRQCQTTPYPARKLWLAMPPHVQEVTLISCSWAPATTRLFPAPGPVAALWRRLAVGFDGTCSIFLRTSNHTTLCMESTHSQIATPEPVTTCAFLPCAPDHHSTAP